MPHARDMKRRSKAGVTLVEVMLAGAMTALIVLSTLEGFTLAPRIAKENAKAIDIDNVAFDLMWREFNKGYEQLELLIGKTPTLKNTYSDTDSPYRCKNGSDSLASSVDEYPQYKYKVEVNNDNGGLRLTLKLYDKGYSGGNEGEHLLRRFSMFRSNIPR